jgi:aryl-alcohol dehydrogenase-like predicted oxidoreductase
MTLARPMTLRHALDAGETVIDTADSYGSGHTETLVGPVIACGRHEIVVATKFGFFLPPESEPYAFPVGFNFGELAVNC